MDAMLCSQARETAVGAVPSKKKKKKKSQIYKAILNGRALCQCGFTDRRSLLDDTEGEKAQRWFREVRDRVR